MTTAPTLPLDRDRSASDENLHFALLRSRGDIDDAARELGRREWVQFDSNLLRSLPVAALRRLLNRPSLAPDPIKAWDVLRALRAITATTAADEAILDLGSVACPVLPCLHALGYGDLHGVDLDPHVREMPFAGAVDYRQANMTAAPWPDGTFSAITAISVIEHGFEQDALLDEITRLLRPGGVFIFSTDYWPQKISTDGVHLFGLDWRIFSAAEIEQMLEAAASRGLYPVVSPAAALRPDESRGQSEPAVAYHRRAYTFLYGALVQSSTALTRGER
jgi:SAM-dependent methyltransferase